MKWFLLLFLSYLSFSKSYGQLNGNYTVGPGGYFPSIQSAFDTLRIKGMSGNVNLKLRNGTFNEQPHLDSVSGGPSVNERLTIESESGNPADVMIHGDLIFTKVSNLTIQRLSIESNPAGVNFFGSYSNIRILNNIFKNGFYSVYHWGNGYVSNFLIEGNTMNNNLQGCIYLAANGFRFTNVMIRNNYINVTGRYSIVVANCDSISIENNTIIGSYQLFFSVYTNTGIAFGSCGQSIRILKNKILASGYPQPPGNGKGIGIEIQNCNEKKSLIANNFITSNYGDPLVVINSKNLNIYFNSLNSVNTSNLPNNVCSFNNCDSINLKDNILCNKTSNTSLQNSFIYHLTNSNLNSNYNDLFYEAQYIASINNQLIPNHEQLVFQAHIDSNSVFRKPHFVSDTNLHLTGSSIGDPYLRGIPIPAVTDDIDGDPRSPVFPYMGADEPPPNISIYLLMFIEGFYDPSVSTMVPDTIMSYLRTDFSPYNIVDSAKTLLDENGYSAPKFHIAPSGIYFLVEKHRNSIETWSSAGVAMTIGEETYYDFTLNVTQAYGNNLKLKESEYCVYSGDVNKDGVVDAADLISVFNDASQFLSGYINTDLDGDNYADVDDLLICYNNMVSFVQVIRP